MAAISFDTLAYVRRIVAAGVSREQAEAQADAMKEAFLDAGSAGCRGAIADCGAVGWFVVMVP